MTPTRSDGRPDNILDLIHDGKECRFLRNWDPEKPQRIDPAHQGSANAVVMPDSTDYRTMPDSSDPGIGLFLSFARAPGDDHWNLDELGRKSPSVKLLGQADVEGVKCYHLRLAHPADPGKRDRSYYDVFLDPSAGFLVRKSITHVERGDPGTGAYNHVAIVTKFRECKPGVFFPVEAHIEGTENTIARTVVRKILLNDPLPRDALDFTFPKHILVRHYPPDKGVVRTEIWGDNNVALKEYKSPDDIAEWVSAADFTAAGNWSPWMHGGILVLLAVFVAVLMIRRARA